MNSQIGTGFMALFLGLAAFAGEAADRGQLYGQWTTQDGTETWAFQDNGSKVKISHTKGAETVSDFACGTVGRDCECNVAGKKTTVSMYYYGPKLVQLERRGDEVLKRRFTVGEAGDALVVEVIPIAPTGKTETMHFRRVSTTAKEQ